MPDQYKNFQELFANETEGVDYKIETEDRGTDFAIIGIHGGEIEPNTEKVVRAIAGTDLSFYIFLGNAEHQHITSIHFDEKRCIDLVSKSKKVISIHGKKGDGEFVMLGGLDDDLISGATQALQEAGFEIDPTASNVTGTEPSNICNRCLSGKGLQVEMSKGLRDSLAQDDSRMERFTQIIRNLIQ